MLAVLILCIFLGLSFPTQALAQNAEQCTMRFTVADWAYEVRDEGDYDSNPSGIFSRGERGYAYLEIEGFGVGQKENLFYLLLNVDVALETRNGLRLFSQKDVLELEEWYFEEPGSTWLHLGRHPLVGAEGCLQDTNYGSGRCYRGVPRGSKGD